MPPGHGVPGGIVVGYNQLNLGQMVTVDLRRGAMTSRVPLDQELGQWQDDTTRTTTGPVTPVLPW